MQTSATPLNSCKFTVATKEIWIRYFTTMDGKQNNSGDDNENSPLQQNGDQVGANGNGGAPNDGNAANNQNYQNGNNGNHQNGINGGDNQGPFIIDPASLTTNANQFIINL